MAEKKVRQTTAVFSKKVILFLNRPERVKNRREMKMSTKLNTITGEALMNMDLPPKRMIVERFLPQGLHLLAGAPKTGKSWLTMLLCLKVSNGEPFWNMPTQKGTVLYLCLEDSLNRIQERMADLTDTDPPNLYFATMAETINEGLVRQIEEFKAEQPDLILVAIDTLQCIRKISGDMNAYAKDYADTKILKQIADEYGIAILLIHHLRKQTDSDIFNMISGTTGLTGGVDGSYILERDAKNPYHAKLRAKGRDIEEVVFSLEFDKETHVWNFISDDSDDPFSLADDKDIKSVIDFIKVGKIFEDKTSELAKKINTNTRPNILSRKLWQNKMALAAMGITVNRLRASDKRGISLTYKSSAGDDDDDKSSSDSASKLSSGGLVSEISS